jgi:mRNA deadenylase 3'-5' endonuclease subunit Ccr4
MEPRKPSLTVATYNVLASAYVQRARYPRVSAIVLDPAWRVPALAQHITSFDTDVLCLQEVESATLGALRSRLGPSRHAARYARKNGGSPEGCATFYRHDVLQLIDEIVIPFSDGGAAETATGNVALITIFRAAARRIGVVNTHLTWDPPGTARECRRGLRQILELLLEYKNVAASAEAWIIGGDFNVPPDSEIVSLIEESGFRCAHHGRPVANTCSFNGEAKKIDYLFHSQNLQSYPYEVCPIDGRTILPSAEQPSDHVAVIARFEFIA